MPGMVLRGVTRAIAEGVMQNELQKGGGLVGGLIGAVASAATEVADDRMWRMLPGRVYIARGYLPPGEHVVTVNGRALPDPVKIDGQYALVPLRLYENTVLMGNVASLGKLAPVDLFPWKPASPCSQDTCCPHSHTHHDQQACGPLPARLPRHLLLKTERIPPSPLAPFHDLSEGDLFDVRPHLPERPVRRLRGFGRRCRRPAARPPQPLPPWPPKWPCAVKRTASPCVKCAWCARTTSCRCRRTCPVSCTVTAPCSTASSGWTTWATRWAIGESWKQLTVWAWASKTIKSVAPTGAAVDLRLEMNVEPR